MDIFYHTLRNAYENLVKQRGKSQETWILPDHFSEQSLFDRALDYSALFMNWLKLPKN